MRIALISSQKGGVGKSSTAWSLAAGLAQRGYKVLAIDSDPQCNLSFVSGVTDTFSVDASLLNIYKGDKKAAECVMPVEAGYDLICGSIELTAADLLYSGKTGREYILRKALEDVKDDYDFCVIDTPPFIGLLVQNCLATSFKTDIIIPINADVLSVQALTYYVRLLNDIKQGLLDSKFEISGVLITKSKRENAQSATEKQMLEAIESGTNAIGLKLYDTKIRDSAKVPAAMLVQTDIFTYDKKSNPSIDYSNFIDEYLEGVVR